MWNRDVFIKPNLTYELWPRSRYIWSSVQCPAERMGQILRGETMSDDPWIYSLWDNALDEYDWTDRDARHLTMCLTFGGWFNTPRSVRKNIRRDIQQCGKIRKRTLFLPMSLRWAAPSFAQRARQRPGRQRWNPGRRANEGGPHAVQGRILSTSDVLVAIQSWSHAVLLVVDTVDGSVRLWDPHGSAERHSSNYSLVLPNGTTEYGCIHEILGRDEYRSVWSELGLRYTALGQTNRAGLQTHIERNISAYERHFVSGLCRTVAFLVCCVCQRLNTHRIDDVTDALVDWVWSFHTMEQRGRMRLALLIWIRRCYYAKDYERLMTWIGVIAPPVYTDGDGPRQCGIWDDAARRFCHNAPWGVYTVCERHARAILPEFRSKRDREPYPQPPVDEWVDVDRSADVLRVVTNGDPLAQREAKRRRLFIAPVPARPGPEEFEWGPRELSPDHRSFMRPDTDDGPGYPLSDSRPAEDPPPPPGLFGGLWQRFTSLF